MAGRVFCASIGATDWSLERALVPVDFACTAIAPSRFAAGTTDRSRSEEDLEALSAAGLCSAIKVPHKNSAAAANATEPNNGRVR